MTRYPPAHAVGGDLRFEIWYLVYPIESLKILPPDGDNAGIAPASHHSLDTTGRSSGETQPP